MSERIVIISDCQIPFDDRDAIAALVQYIGDTQPDKVAPGWVTTHGHRGGIRLTQKAGDTALNAAVRFNTSVVMGHTHRLGLKPETKGFGGTVSKSLWGMEVGNLMNMRMATYLKGGTANWQQGFGVLTVEGSHVKPNAIPIAQGYFTVDGETWGV